MQREEAVQQIQRLQELSAGSKIQRFLHAPWLYLRAQITYRFLFPLLKRGFWATASTFFGTQLRLLLPAATDLYIFGGKTHSSELRLSLFWIKNLPQGVTVLDVGAHFGFYSQLASQLVGPTGKVVSLEASKEVFTVLEQNTEMANIQRIHAAAGSENGSITFYEFPIFYSEYNTLHPEQYQADSWFQRMAPQAQETRQIALASWLEEQQLQPSWIKIDVEGAEWEVLQGLGPYLQRHAVTLSLEYVVDSSQASAYQKSFEQLTAWGYDCYWINEQGALEICDQPGDFLSLRGLDSDNLIFRRPMS
ncbi:MAG: FkbM family methyltransferase [Bacteroidota bacterium]